MSRNKILIVLLLTSNLQVWAEQPKQPPSKVPEKTELEKAQEKKEQANIRKDERKNKLKFFDRFRF